ncbi:MAG: hypothetical protein M5U34_12535 [Chloroflexi bacterium]|nr:hypothetical protein [Chloroflexota bacterium]
MINRYSVLRQRLQIEWQEVRQAAEKAIQAYDQLTPKRTDASVYLDSIVLNLHGFYNGLERIFEWLAKLMAPCQKVQRHVIDYNK